MRELIGSSDARLRTPSKRVAAVDDAVRELAADMAEVMFEHGGVGLAAPQIGVLRRVIVYKAPSNGEVRVLVNPWITRSSGRMSHQEACLSLPGVLVWVQRAAEVTVRGSDHTGRRVRIRATGGLARRLQHEIDHLDGVLITDHAAKAA
jgi:peptide deformylase